MFRNILLLFVKSLHRIKWNNCELFSQRWKFFLWKHLRKLFCNVFIIQRYIYFMKFFIFHRLPPYLLYVLMELFLITIGREHFEKMKFLSMKDCTGLNETMVDCFRSDGSIFFGNIFKQLPRRHFLFWPVSLSICFLKKYILSNFSKTKKMPKIFH